MEIIVKGEAEKSFRPDQIEISFDFRYKNNDYDKVLSVGAENVKNYLNFLMTLGFNRDDVKTRSLKVSEDSRYDEKTRKYFKEGYVFSQSAKLKFDYNLEKLSSIMEETSKLDNPPIYRFNFTLKDQKQTKEELLAIAYDDAKSQAKAISKASGLKLKGCAKVSFEPIGSDMYSCTSYDGCYSKMSKMSCEGVASDIQTILVPEDVMVSCDVYCVFIAE